MTTLRALTDSIEDLVHEDVGRNTTALFAQTKGGLWSAAQSLAATALPHAGFVTGFYVPTAEPPGAETDGPLGAALLIRGLTNAGISCRLVTDELCRQACEAALAGAGVRNVPVQSVAANASPLDVVSDWRRNAVTHAIAVERCGRCADGTMRDMRGGDISHYTADLDTPFSAGPWDTIAVGDGGNEIGMGNLPRQIIAENIDNGGTIACVTRARHLISAGVSNWGAYALIAALALLRRDWRDAMLDCLQPSVHNAALQAMVTFGPAVDGVSGRQSMSVDSLPLQRHVEKLAAIRAVLGRCESPATFADSANRSSIDSAIATPEPGRPARSFAPDGGKAG
jgi:D-glutamate cyclase